MPAPNQKCHNCQSNLALPCFDNREKGYSVCSPCMEEMKRELESKGQKAKLWDNFFSYFNEQGTEHGFVCSFCVKPIQNCQEHQENGDKMIIKHKCQVECKKSIGCGKPYQLTQDYADWITKYKKSIFGSNFNSKLDLTKCPNCEIKEIKEKLKKDGSWLGRKYINEKKEALKELERLTGKGNNDNQEREREREFWLTFNSTISNPLLYKVINF